MLFLKKLEHYSFIGILIQIYIYIFFRLIFFVVTHFISYFSFAVFMAISFCFYNWNNYWSSSLALALSFVENKTQRVLKHSALGEVLFLIIL